MPRRHGRRQFPAPLQLGAGYTCLGCDEAVSAVRLCCGRCWPRIPGPLRTILNRPGVQNPHLESADGYTAARDAARAYLERGRERTAAAMAREERP